jgi:hypothetical protein
MRYFEIDYVKQVVKQRKSYHPDATIKITKFEDIMDIHYISELRYGSVGAAANFSGDVYKERFVLVTKTKKMVLYARDKDERILWIKAYAKILDFKDSKFNFFSKTSSPNFDRIHAKAIGKIEDDFDGRKLERL